MEKGVFLWKIGGKWRLGTQQKTKGASQIGWAQAIRDVLIASMNKGQFPLAIASLIVIILLLRMPPDDLSKLVFLIIDPLQRWYFAGYVISFTVTGGWYIHAKWQRKIFNDEMARVSSERNQVQKQQLGVRIKSSS